jgi:hypothetical protein
MPVKNYVRHLILIFYWAAVRSIHFSTYSAYSGFFSWRKHKKTVTCESAAADAEC